MPQALDPLIETFMFLECNEMEKLQLVSKWYKKIVSNTPKLKRFRRIHRLDIILRNWGDTKTVIFWFFHFQKFFQFRFIVHILGMNGVVEKAFIDTPYHCEPFTLDDFLRLRSAIQSFSNCVVNELRISPILHDKTVSRKYYYNFKHMIEWHFRGKMFHFTHFISQCGNKRKLQKFK